MSTHDLLAHTLVYAIVLDSSMLRAPFRRKSCVNLDRLHDDSSNFTNGRSSAQYRQLYLPHSPGCYELCCSYIVAIGAEPGSDSGLRGARKLGKTLYGATNNYYSPVQRLPFGLFLKFNSEPACFRNEFKALQLVRQHTTVPVPKPLDIAIIRQRDGTASESSFPSDDATF